MKWLHYLIAVLVAVIISCGITMGYHYLYVRPADNIIVENVNKNTQYAHDMAAKQEKNQLQISHTIDFIVTVQGLMNKDAIGYRVKVGKAFSEVITNFTGAEERIKTLERRHLELLRAIAVLNKKHWDPAKAAEASGLEWKE